MKQDQLIKIVNEKKELSFYLKKIENDPQLISNLLDIIEQNPTSVKYQAEKIIRKASEELPRLLYPYFERISSLLNHDNHFIKWGSILTIANLLAVDEEKKWLDIREQYLQFFHSDQLVEFGNAVISVEKILTAYKEEQKEILPVLLKTADHIFLHHVQVSKDCQNIAIGHVLTCFEQLYPNSNYQKEMITFALQNSDNERKQVCLKARHFLKKYQ